MCLCRLNLITFQIPAVCSTFISGGTTTGFGFPFITLGSTTTTTGTAAGAITGLSAASATLAGLGGG